MRRSRIVGRGRYVVALVLLAGSGALLPVQATAATCVSWSGGPGSLSPGAVDNYFTGVAVLSPCNAWAVGATSESGPRQTLVEHWDGRAWTVSASPTPGVAAGFAAVAAVSASNVWAVGNYYDGANTRTLVEHWNGGSWSQIGSPAVGTASLLTGVAASSSSNVWAVGYTNDGTVNRTLVLHWTGTKWKVVASPNPGAGIGDNNYLSAVTATSGTNAWAVGYHVPVGGGSARHLLLHWNGTKWRQYAAPTFTRDNELTNVSANSGSNAWAVGYLWNGTANQTLILHWNGTKWRRVSSPNPSGAADTNELFGVAAVSGKSAWAVGDRTADGTIRGLVLRWNGTSWKALSLPNPNTTNSYLLNAVDASSADNVWTVGSYNDGSKGNTVALHCC